MPYLGTQAAVGFSKTTKDRFSGDNSTTGFTMSQAANTATDIQVFVDNIRQEPTIAYSVSGATLTFTEAPPTGTNNVYVVHQHQALGTGPLPPQDLGSKDYIFGDDISFNSDGAIVNFGLDSEIKLAHVHNTGLSLQSDSSQLLFGADNDINLTHVHNTGLPTNGNLSLKSDSSVLKFGADEEVTLTHNHNAGLTLGGTTPTLTIGDAGAEDAKIVFDGNAQDFHVGLDDSADDLVIGVGSALGTTAAIVIDEDGHVTKPLQSAFSVELGTDITNAGTGYTTIVLDTERFDLNGDFDTSTGKFTAPVTGKYMLTATVLFDQLSPGGQYINLDLNTSNISYEGAYVDTDTFDSTSIAHTLTVTALADMDANDTALLRSYNNTGTTTHDIDGDTSQMTVFMTGFLAC